MRRITIYAFYDPDGLVDDYVVDCVAAMSEHSEKVLVVVNDKVQAASRARLTDIPRVQVVQRTNKGFDIWGYKHGLDFVGWSELERYDEVLLMNSTIAGPLYPLSELFDTMDAQDVDFWGLTMHAGEDYDPWNLLPTGKLERHIQSYFMAVRKRMLQSQEFRDYWDALPPIRSYTEAVALHEAVFTHRFAELGFQWTTYVDSTDLEHLTPYALMFLPEQVLIGKRCPFFKRKALFLPAPDLVATQATSTTTMIECLDALGYDLQRVLPNVIRTSHQSDVRLSLNAFEVLSPRPEDDAADLSKVRVVAWVKDLTSCMALERCRAALERCGEVVIVTGRDPADRIVRRLTELKARVVTGAPFAQFVREIGRAAGTTDHVLVLGHTDEFAGLSELGVYVRSELTLRALAGTGATLASAVRQLESSKLAGAFAGPPTSTTLAAQNGAWGAISDRIEILLAVLDVQVPISPGKPAWGPPGGVVLAGPGMLAADWNLVANAVSHLSEPMAQELFAALIPFIVQGHGRLLVFALPERLTANAIFAGHLQTAQAADHRTLSSRLEARASREFHKLRRRLRDRARTATDGPGRV